MANIVVTAWADIEARAQREGRDPHWHEAGDFLSDAIAGMLAAPIATRPAVP